MGFRIAGHTNSYHTYSLTQALDGIAAAGFEYVELTAVPGWTEHVDVTMDAAGRRALQATLKELGLEVVSLSAHEDLTTDAGVEHTLRALRFAAEMEIPIVNTAVGGHASKQEDEEAFLARIAGIADLAEQLGLVVALETHGEIMATGLMSNHVLERINRPRSIRLNYDTANVRFYGAVQAEDDIRTTTDWLAHVHLKDHVGWKGEWNFPALGTGQVDFRSIFESLRSTGYTGPLSVELEFSGEPWPPLSQVNEAMRASFQHLKELGVV